MGWLLLGWIIIPVWILIKSMEGVVRLFLAAMQALDRHNRRKAQTAHRTPVQPREWNYGRPPQDQVPPGYRRR